MDESVSSLFSKVKQGVSSERLDLAYRWLFGMITDQELAGSRGFIDPEFWYMITSYVSDMPAFKSRESSYDGKHKSLFKGLKRPVLGDGVDSIHFSKFGMGCGNPLESIYGEYTQQMRCASGHYDTHVPLINYIERFVRENNMYTVLIDSANLMGGSGIDFFSEDSTDDKPTKYFYEDEPKVSKLELLLDQLPVVYKHRPVFYIVVVPNTYIVKPVFSGNKFFLPVSCFIPLEAPRRGERPDLPGGRTLGCKGSGVGETDDILLIQIYNHLHAKNPNTTYVLSGDKYKWRGKSNLPSNDNTNGHTNINYLKIVRKPIGLSSVSLAVNRSSAVNRQIAYSLETHSDAPDWKKKTGRGAAAPKKKTKHKRK